MTITDLQQLTNEQLAALAAEKIMGWREIVSRIDPIGNVAVPCHLWEGEQPGDGLPFSHWQPALDRNQSGELLIAVQRLGGNIKYRIVDGLPEISIHPRAESIAALLAWFAMEKQ